MPDRQLQNWLSELTDIVQLLWHHPSPEHPAPLTTEAWPPGPGSGQCSKCVSSRKPPFLADGNNHQSRVETAVRVQLVHCGQPCSRHAWILPRPRFHDVAPNCTQQHGGCVVSILRLGTLLIFSGRLCLSLKVNWVTNLPPFPLGRCGDDFLVLLWSNKLS